MFSKHEIVKNQIVWLPIDKWLYGAICLFDKDCIGGKAYSYQLIATYSRHKVIISIKILLVHYGYFPVRDYFSTLSYHFNIPNNILGQIKSVDCKCVNQ